MNNRVNYIDIHTHILPGVDDGSGSMEETIRMLQIASEQQITTIIATPHYLSGLKNASVEHLKQLRDQVQAEAYKINKEFKILLGNELFYSESILSALKSKEALTLAGSRYILVEFPVKEVYKTIFRGLGELVRHGYLPILAHVERYHCLNKKADLIGELVELGCYIQMNSSSLIGGIFNSEASWNRKLLTQGLVHFVGSDCHDQKVRVPSMKMAAQLLQKKYDQKLINQIFIENPLKILANTYI
ncbi:MAG: CpsB/CapC family capsule biosynthesis tyrosine phosphatase [Mobilitalea sp.]